MTNMDMKHNTTWSESPIHKKVKDAGLDTAANIHCADKSGSVESYYVGCAIDLGKLEASPEMFTDTSENTEVSQD